MQEKQKQNRLFGGQERNKKNFPAAQRRTFSGAVAIRQKEEREIKELEARIEVEMPLSGLVWTPLLSGTLKTSLRGGAAHPLLTCPEASQTPAVSAQRDGTVSTSFCLKEAEKAGKTLPTGLSTLARQASVSAKAHSLVSPRETAAGDEPSQGKTTEGKTAGEDETSHHALTLADSAAAAYDTSGNAPTLSHYFFADLPLSSNTRRGLRDGGFVLLSQIQLRVIPHALRGADVMGEAKTGSGKTLAFLVPVLESLYRNRISSIDGVSALILAPTRELAVQIFNVVKVVSRYHDFSAGCLIGGKNVAEEAERVHTLNIVVGTPGRVLQHTEESQLWDAANLKILVIDEADRLADMGFIQTTRFIIEQLPAKRQTLFFSATLRMAVKRLASFAARPDAEIISVGGGGGLGVEMNGVSAGGQRNNNSSDSSRIAATPLTLTQRHMIVPPQYKLSALFSLLRTHSSKKSLVFVSSCKQARFVAESFKQLKPGLKIFFLHGRQKQARRIGVFHDFIQRSSGCCLISTDLASRGIDFAQLSVGRVHAASGRSNSSSKRGGRDRYTAARSNIGVPRGLSKGSSCSASRDSFAGVDVVVQLDCPDSVETYIHRVGRTARMQRSGHALLLLLPSEREFISRLKDRKIEPKEVFINPQRAVKIEKKLQALLASNLELKQLAQQALGCYLRCIALMPDKQVFSLPTDRQTLTLFANAYGLQLPPKITFLTANVGVGSRSANGTSASSQGTSDVGEDVRICGGALGASVTKKKNLSKLERLKEKIRQRRLEKQERQRLQGSNHTAASSKPLAESAPVAASDLKADKTTTSETLMPTKRIMCIDNEPSTSSGESDSSSGTRKKNRAVTRHGAHYCGKQQSGANVGQQQDDANEQLFSVRKPQHDEEVEGDAKDTLIREQLIQKPGFKRERLKFRADGTAKIKGLAAAELPRQHVFFDDEEEDNKHVEERSHGSLTASTIVKAKHSKCGSMLVDAAAIEATPNRDEPATLTEYGGSTRSSGSAREAFLASMKTRLLLQEAADKERDRQRVHERHTTKRVKERLRRCAEAAGLKGDAVGNSQAVFVPDLMPGSSSSDKETDSEHASEKDEGLHEGERDLGSQGEVCRQAVRTLSSGRGGLSDAAPPATGGPVNLTEHEGVFRNKSLRTGSTVKEAAGSSTKKRCVEIAGKTATCVKDKQRQEVSLQQQPKKQRLTRPREDKATRYTSIFGGAEDETSRLERIAVQLLEN